MCARCRVRGHTLLRVSINSWSSCVYERLRAVLSPLSMLISRSTLPTFFLSFLFFLSVAIVPRCCQSNVFLLFFFFFFSKRTHASGERHRCGLWTHALHWQLSMYKMNRTSLITPKCGQNSTLICKTINMIRNVINMYNTIRLIVSTYLIVSISYNMTHLIVLLIQYVNINWHN